MEPIALAEIEAARERIKDMAVRTPLVRLNVEHKSTEIYLKLENLQPIGSFKLRGAGNAMAIAGPEALAGGVYTASAGNMAQGVAWNARRLGIDCTVVVPDHAPETKLAAIERLGGTIVKVPFDEWWEVIVTHRFDGVEGVFIHPVCDRAVIAGNGTIGLEIFEDLPEVDTVIVPYGGGGLSSGIASAMRALKPEVLVYAAEVSTSAALAAALDSGEPTEIDYSPSFVDGIGSNRVLDEMWPLVRRLLAGSLVVDLDDVSAAIRLMVERNRIVAEGAGAAAVAAALRERIDGTKIVCIVSGGNIDTKRLLDILAVET